MERFDVVVVGAGSGLNIVDSAARHGFKVALVEEGPMGGTCLNRGCIPSKMLIHSADVAEAVRSAGKFGIKTGRFSVDFGRIVSGVSSLVDRDARDIEEGILEDRNITLFRARGRFVGKKQLKVGSHVITGERFFVLAGTRPMIPGIPGLEGSGFITSDGALRLKRLPKSLTIIGGGYIAAELAHFFSALGSRVTIIQREELLVPNEDREVAEAFTDAFRKRYSVLLGYSAESVSRKGNIFSVTASHGKLKRTLKSEQLLVAVGRVPNSDLLDVAAGGIKVNERGYIITDDYLETSVKGVWAAGDIAGKYLFKHSANLESQYAYGNALNHSSKVKVDYYAMPHAIFSSPQVAGVGAREQDLKKGSYGVGKYMYSGTGMGAALKDTGSFVKILVEKGANRILGCHIIGPDASTLIHEVVVAMRCGSGAIGSITGAVHVHPALSEVVQRAANNVSFK